MIKSYKLCGLIYFDAEHFIARIIDVDGDIWCYDGLRNDGVCKHEDKISEKS
jgi:hypothetical protein